MRHLIHYIALAETRQFTAARRVNVVQSGLSVMIKELEEEIGSKLVNRTTRSDADRGRGVLSGLCTIKSWLTSRGNHSCEVAGWDCARAAQYRNTPKPHAVCQPSRGVAALSCKVPAGRICRTYLKYRWGSCPGALLEYRFELSSRCAQGDSERAGDDPLCT